MPPVSEKQRRAMRAAAAGKSTIGIPAKVGKEFSNADPGGKLPEKKKAVDRSAHWKGNPGFPSSSMAGTSPPPDTLQTHEAREREVMGAGYKAHEAAERASTPSKLTEPVVFNNPNRGFRAAPAAPPKRDGRLRLSGHSGAHRIGKR